MKFSVDRIEENIVIIQNLTTKEIIEISKDVLPNNIQDGSIITYENNKYVLDHKYKKKRETIIREKIDRLKRLKTKESESNE